MKLVNGGGGGGGAGGSSGVGGGGGAGVAGGAEKAAFSFKKCSAFQFVKRKVSLEEACLWDGEGTDGARSRSVLGALPAKDDVIFSAEPCQDAAESEDSLCLCDITAPHHLGSPELLPCSSALTVNSYMTLHEKG